MTETHAISVSSPISVRRLDSTNWYEWYLADSPTTTAAAEPTTNNLFGIGHEELADSDSSDDAGAAAAAAVAAGGRRAAARRRGVRRDQYVLKKCQLCGLLSDDDSHTSPNVDCVECGQCGKSCCVMCVLNAHKAGVERHLSHRRMNFNSSSFLKQSICESTRSLTVQCFFCKATFNAAVVECAVSAWLTSQLSQAEYAPEMLLHKLTLTVLRRFQIQLMADRARNVTTRRKLKDLLDDLES